MVFPEPDETAPSPAAPALRAHHEPVRAHAERRGPRGGARSWPLRPRLWSPSWRGTGKANRMRAPPAPRWYPCTSLRAATSRRSSRRRREPAASRDWQRGARFGVPQRRARPRRDPATHAARDRPRRHHLPEPRPRDLDHGASASGESSCGRPTPGRSRWRSTISSCRSTRKEDCSCPFAAGKARSPISPPPMCSRIACPRGASRPDRVPGRHRPRHEGHRRDAAGHHVSRRGAARDRGRHHPARRFRLEPSRRHRPWSFS